MTDTSKIQLRVSDRDIERWDDFVSESMLVSTRSELIRRSVGVYIQEHTQYSVSDGLQVDDTQHTVDDTSGDMQEAIDLLDYISAEMEQIKRQTEGIDDLATSDDLSDVEQSLRLALNNTTDE